MVFFIFFINLVIPHILFFTNAPFLPFLLTLLSIFLSKKKRGNFLYSLSGKIGKISFINHFPLLSIKINKVGGHMRVVLFGNMINICLLIRNLSKIYIFIICMLIFVALNNLFYFCLQKF